jgi:hypothetical protein
MLFGERQLGQSKAFGIGRIILPPALRYRPFQDRDYPLPNPARGFLFLGQDWRKGIPSI